ncbi:MAG TPA: hypothetical protein VM658_01245 [bacterium]|nr:hypothetical protein [bacterium]
MIAAVCALAWPLSAGLSAGDAGPDAEAAFARMAAAIDAVRDYRAEFTHYSATTGERALVGRRTAVGKFLRSPRLYWVKIVAMDDNFKDPTEPGTQLIFDSRGDELKVLLTGAKRLLGVIHIFAEDVKCTWLNGERPGEEAMWDQLEIWRARLKQGSLALRSEAFQGKRFEVITITYAAESFGGSAAVSRVDVWVDPDDRLPRRWQGFVHGSTKPVMDYELKTLETNVGLTPDDVEFEGLSLWSFPAQFVANGKGLDKIKYQPLLAAAGQAPAFPELHERFTAALDRIKDYRAELMFTQKYFRLRSQGKLVHSVIKDPRFFLFEFDPDFRINHLHLASSGVKVCYHRDERLYAALGSGAMRVVGVQLMSVDDPRSGFAFGEGLASMDLFSLRDRMRWYETNGQVSTSMVAVAGRPMPRALIQRPGKPRPGQIQDMAVVFDPDTWLPRRVEYLNTYDPDGFAVIEYQGIKTNLGLKEEEMKF